MAYTGTATGDTGMGSLVSIYYDKLAVETLKAAVVVYNKCSKRALPQHGGKVITFHRYVASSGVVSAYALTEGGSGAWPTWGLLSATAVTATMGQYGRAIQTTDLLELTAVSDIVKDAIKFLMEEAADIIDRRILDIAYNVSASQGVYGGAIPTGASGGFDITWPSAQGYTIAALSLLTSACHIDVNGIKKALKTLKADNCHPLDNGYYCMITHPDSTAKLMSDSSWQNAYQYTKPENMRKGEVGRIYNVEVTETTNIFWTVSGTGTPNTVSAYFSILFGKDGLAVTEIDGGLKTFVKRPNQYDSANPLDQWSSIGWKMNFVPVVLNESCGTVLITAD